MQFQCCVSNCYSKPGAPPNLYALPNPVENKVLIEKWVQKLGGDSDDLKDLFARKNLLVCETHFQDLYIENPEIHKKHIVVKEPKEKLNAFKTIDAEKVPLVEIRKCAVNKPEVISSAGKPMFVMQKKKINGKEKSSLLLLQPINNQCSNKKSHVQATTQIKEPIELKVAQEVEVITTETIDNNKTTAKNCEKEVVQKNSSHQVLNTTDLIKTKDIKVNEDKTKVFVEDSFESFVNNTGMQKPLRTYTTNFHKCKKNPETIGKPAETVGAITNIEIPKPTVVKIVKTYPPTPKQDAIQPQTGKLMSYKDFNNLLTKATPHEKNNVDTQKVNTIILKKDNVVVYDQKTDKPANIVQCGSIATGFKMVQVPQPSVARDIASVAVTLGKVENPEVKEDKNRSPAPNVMRGQNLSSNIKIVQNLLVLPNKAVENSSVDVIKRDEYFDIGVAEIEVPEVAAPDVEISEFSEPKIELPELQIAGVPFKGVLGSQVPEPQINTTPKIIVTNVENKWSDKGVRLKSTASLLSYPIKRRIEVAADEVNKIIENIRNIRNIGPTQGKDLTIDSATLLKLTYEEAENVKRIMKSYNDQTQDLMKEIRNLKKNTMRHKKVIIALKKKVSDLKVNSKIKAFEMITKDMTEDAKMIIRMQVANHKKKPEGRRFNLKEKIFALALYKLSRQAYRYMSTILALPTKNTLNKFLHAFLTNDGTTDVPCYDVKDNAATDIISHEVKNDTAKNNKVIYDNSTTQNIDETAAAVAAITDESAIPDTPRCNENNVTQKKVECLANETNYPNFEAYTDDVFIQNDSLNCNSHTNEIVFTEFVEQRHDQTPKVIKIPTNFGTVSVGYSEYTQEFDLCPDKQSISPLKKGSVLNHKKTNNISNQTQTKSKSAPPTLEEKNKQIDYVLSKMMTPDQLKKLYPISRKKKKVSKKTGGGAGDGAKKIGKPRVQSGNNRTTKPALRTQNDIRDKIMEFIANFKQQQITPTLSHHTQTKPISAVQPDIPQGDSDFTQVMANRCNTEMYRLGPTTKHKKNTSHYVQPEQTNIGVRGHITDSAASAYQDTANENNSNLNEMDTVEKLRRNLQKYSPKKKVLSDTSFIDSATQTTARPKQMVAYTGKRKVQSTGEDKNNYHYEKPVKTKRKNELVIDESRVNEYPPRRLSSEMIVRGTQDGNRSEYENFPSHRTEESVRGRGFDMPDLSDHFNSSYDSTNRKRFGFKRLPTNPC